MAELEKLRHDPTSALACKDDEECERMRRNEDSKSSLVDFNLWCEIQLAEYAEKSRLQNLEFESIKAEWEKLTGLPYDRDLVMQRFFDR